MRTTILQQQHQKCLVALEMIQNCDKFISNCKENLRRHLATPWINQMPGVETFNMKNINKYRRIKKRLALYYSNQFMKMIDPVAMAMEDLN